MGKKRQTARSRDERQKAERELMDDFSIDNDNNNNNNNNDEKLDGKTRVQDKVAELSVRGVIDEDEDMKPKDKKKAMHIPGVNEGIKKKTSGRKLSSKQKKRQQQAMSKAEQWLEQREKKVDESVDKFKKNKERKKPWEEYEDVIKKSQNKFDALNQSLD